MKTIYALIISSCLTIAAIGTANAQSGSLDLSFGSGGIVTTSFVSSYVDNAFSVALQPDGKIVAAGFSYNAGTLTNFSLARYNNDGSLDNAFGSAGQVTTDFTSATDVGRSVVLQPDGKIVMAGDSYNGLNSDFGLVRYNSDGSLDITFGSGGKVTTTIGSADDVGNSVVLQSDGKIVVAGYSRNGSYDDFALTRYNSDGSLDNSFGTVGKVTTDILGYNDRAFSVVLQSDGKIVATGFSVNGSDSDFALVRYNSDGSLDNTFGSSGKLTTAIGSGGDNGNSVALQTDGKIVVAGVSYDGSNNKWALVRYNSDGSLDNTFDTDGKVTTAIGSTQDEAKSLVLQADGKIVVAGNSKDSIYFYSDFAVARYNSNGSLDNTFGSGGKVTTHIGNTPDGGESVAIQTDGKIVVAGSSSGTPEFAVVRYNGIGVGIQENTRMVEVSIYPNPAKDKFIIQLSDLPLNSNLKLNLLNILGQVIKQVSIDSNLTDIELDNISKGIYFYQLQDEQNTLRTGKIIVE